MMATKALWILRIPFCSIVAAPCAIRLIMIANASRNSPWKMDFDIGTISTSRFPMSRICMKRKISLTLVNQPGFAGNGNLGLRAFTMTTAIFPNPPSATRNPPIPGSGHRRARFDQGLQGFLGPIQGARRGQRGFRGASRRSFRFARPEWLRQIHHRQNAPRPLVSHKGTHRGFRPFTAACRHQIAHRVSARGILSLFPAISIRTRRSTFSAICSGFPPANAKSALNNCSKWSG